MNKTKRWMFSLVILWQMPNSVVALFNAGSDAEIYSLWVDYSTCAMQIYHLPLPCKLEKWGISIWYNILG